MYYGNNCSQHLQYSTNYSDILMNREKQFIVMLKVFCILWKHNYHLKLAYLWDKLTVKFENDHNVFAKTSTINISSRIKSNISTVKFCKMKYGKTKMQQTKKKGNLNDAKNSKIDCTFASFHSFAFLLSFSLEIFVKAKNFI